jgi:adenine-specific DNA-methyltransferase
MRYIGSKNNLLKNIDLFIRKNIDLHKEMSMFDAFSGTGSVGCYFKDRFQIYSNDNLYFSYLIQKILIEMNDYPSFNGLKKVGIDNPFDFFNKSNDKVPGEVFNFFSDEGLSERKYLSKDNGQKIDYILLQINEWKKQNIISADEKDYILGSLIYHVPSFSNIGGTYGAFLKHWDKRALKKIEFYGLPIKNNNKKNKSFCSDVNQIIKKVNTDILYLDPPYNNRQYAPNYHMLETIAKEDFVGLRGKTGLRNYDSQKSEFCVKSKVGDALKKILVLSKSKHIILSYSSDGLLKYDQIEDIFKTVLDKDTFSVEKIPYRRFKRTSGNEENTLYEYLFYGQKK